MIKDTKDALALHGLSLNLDKCMVQTNRRGVRLKPLLIDGHEIPMVSSNKVFKVLGTMFTFSGRTSVEFQARMSAAWGKFHQMWPLLGKRDADVSKRLRLFDMSVSQTALWCNESWLLTRREKSRLPSTQNYMLRRIAGPRRKPEEPWVDWVKRSTRSAKTVAKHTGIRFWADEHPRCKWRWAGHVLRMESNRLARPATLWRDSVWWQIDVAWNGPSLCQRRVGRRRWFRWEDELRQYMQQNGLGDWKSMAQDRNEWRSHAAFQNADPLRGHGPAARASPPFFDAARNLT